MKRFICYFITISVVFSSISIIAVSARESNSFNQRIFHGIDYNKIQYALLDVIKNRGEKIQYHENNFVETGFRMIDFQRLREIAIVEDSESHWSKGKYKLRITLLSRQKSKTEVTITPTIMGWRVFKKFQNKDQLYRPANWVPLPSNGNLEEEIFYRISEKLHSE